MCKTQNMISRAAHVTRAGSSSLPSSVVDLLLLHYYAVRRMAAEM